MKLIDNATIISPFIKISDGFIITNDKIIHFIGDAKKDREEYQHFKNKADQIIDFRKKIASPGFIDIHTHGALGKDYSSSPDLLLEDSKFRAATGVTGFLPTIGTFVPADKILNSASKIIELIETSSHGAKAIGINLEGPFINSNMSGGMNSKFCFSDVDLDYLKKAKEIMNDKFKIITISPEVKKSMEAITYLRENGVVPSIGHTIASYELLEKAIRRGASLVTHLLNTTRQPEQNIKGVVVSGVNEYLMIRDEVMAEVICDTNGVHVNPTMLKILLKCKGIDKTIIITDSYMTPGIKGNGKYHMPDGTEFYVKDGVNIQTESEQITGSAMTMDLSVRSMVKHTGVSLEDAILMASYNPAKIIGLQNKKGSIEVGKYADIIAIDEDINVYATIVEGNIIYNRL
jgi:N-acetylglucosamine-6-phosphate deacetylase